MVKFPALSATSTANRAADQLMSSPGIGIPSLVEHESCRCCHLPFRGTRNALYCSKYPCRVAALERERERLRKKRAKDKLARAEVSKSLHRGECGG